MCPYGMSHSVNNYACLEPIIHRVAQLIQGSGMLANGANLSGAHDAGTAVAQWLTTWRVARSVHYQCFRYGGYR